MESRWRKRSAFLYLYLILALGCATAGLEQRVQRLETQIEDLKDESVMEAAGAVGAATRMYGRSALTGATKSVQNISEAGLQDGDLCVVIDDNNYRYFYRWDASNNNTTYPHSVPLRIEPLVSDGTGIWKLSNRSYSEGFYSAAPDGEHYVDASNTSACPASPPQGAICVRDDTNTMYIADSSGTWWPTSGPTYYYTTSQNPLPMVFHWGGAITNYSATNFVQHKLRKAQRGMEITFHISTNNQPIRVDPDDTDKFIGTGFTDGEYYWADGLGEYLRIRAVQNGPLSTDMDWAIVNIGGIWAQQTP